MRLKSLILSLTAVGAMAMPLLYAAPAQAQATRTWVSGVGDDANPCSRTAPCKTFAGAISKTANGGEIDALDPGGFGALTITKSITIDGGGGQVASVLVAGTNGFNISATSSDVIVLRNLRFQGLLGNGGNPGNAGVTGININTAKAVIIDNCDVQGFNTNGIAVNGTAIYLAVNNTRVENVNNAGIVTTDGSASTADINNTKVYLSKFGIVAGTGTKMTVSRSVSSDASTAAFQADASSNMFIDNSVASFSATGIVANVGASVAVGNSDITFNTAGTGGGGTVTSYVNNRCFGNTCTLSAIGSQSNPSGQQ
jgi:hypothetical protein